MPNMELPGIEAARGSRLPHLPSEGTGAREGNRF
jgi:hypothetical protein